MKGTKTTNHFGSRVERDRQPGLFLLDSINNQMATSLSRTACLTLTSQVNEDALGGNPTYAGEQWIGCIQKTV